ncbi:hypothetical protein [Burkholderia aenigmatica]|uniref:Uncharacterized protein n=1 Tax=Burkholderia aenigmatica TaxID=2015348 RepID=A0A228IZG4_9BURK|nr:hypothetical protein [Burkholderia aenigmatica]OXI47657.1 hypothetical protein CFB84_10595 [Burkholderia aenigmatica]
MRPGLLAANNSDQKNINSILYGMESFLERHTGDVNDDGDNLINKFILNNEGILANNMHFEGGPQDYTPTQCSTTEGQALLILGYYYAYKGTGDPKFLDKAKYYFDAYVKFFYGGVPVPNPPDIYRANWMLNGKNPFEVYGPNNPQNVGSPGFYGQPVTFVNGVGQIPTGQPTFGEQTVKVYKVFTGRYAYESVRAGPAHGGTLLPFTSFVATNGTWDSNYDAVTPTPGQPVGTIVLQDTTFNGTASVSYVIHSGVMIPRNVNFDVWPTWRALTPDQFGNAIDAEQWFCEAAQLLYRETGNDYYNQIYQCSLKTCLEASVVDDVTYYFRQEPQTIDPCDYGISYWWSYTPTNSVVNVTRNTAGYIQVTKTEETTASMGTAALEQIAVFNRIQSNTNMNVVMSLSSPAARVEFFTNIVQSVDQKNGQQYRYPLIPNTIPVPTKLSIPFNQMLSVTQSNGQPIIPFDGSNFKAYGSASSGSQFTTFAVGSVTYTDYIGLASVPDSASGVVAGFWLLASNNAPLSPLTYKSLSGQMYLSLRDALGVKYWYALPQAINWTTLNLTWDMFTLAPNQPAGSSPAPTPTNQLTQVIFEIPAGAMSASISTYTWGEVPRYYNPNGEWSTEWFMHVSDSGAFTWLVGDVTIQNELNGDLKYTPGVVPFSNQYSPTLRRNEFWRGTPYTGYQYPVNWLNGGLPTYYENVIQFWYDAQIAYQQRIGVLGPFCPLYVWPRYDNLGEGAIDTFDWGSDQPYPWAGYEPRAMFSACHLWAELVRQGKPVDPKLVTVCQNWAKFLLDFQTNNGGLTPSKFPRNAPPFNDGYNPDPTRNDPDNVGHMTGLFLSACVEMLNAGDTTGIPEQVVKGLLNQFNLTYVIGKGSYADMSGSFSSWPGGHYFYGFWAGEIFRGLGLLLEWLNKGNLLP